MLRHRATQLFDGLADLGSDLVMGGVGLGFAGDLFAAQFILRLRRAEEIGRQFGAAHVI